MKNISRGKKINKSDLEALINSLDISEEEKFRLNQLTPKSYIGLANKLAREI